MGYTQEHILILRAVVIEKMYHKVSTFFVKNIDYFVFARKKCRFFAFCFNFRKDMNPGSETGKSINNFSEKRIVIVKV